MKHLDVIHHKCIMIVLMVLVYVVGVVVGVRLIDDIELDKMVVLLFAFMLLNSMLMYVVFTQLIHLEDYVKNDLKKRRKKK